MALNQFPRRAFSGAATIQTFTGNGSTTAFTLSQAQTQNECFVYVDDVAQVPGVDFTINSTTLTFTSAPANSSEIIVRGFGVPTPLNDVSDNSITTVKLAATGVTAGTYGSASQVPVVTVNNKGQVTGISNTSVAGVSAVSYDSTSGVLTINTSNGGSYTPDLGVGSGDSPTFTNLTLTGNLTVNGTSTTVNATNLAISDPLIYMATGNSANANDIGIVGHFNNGTYQHTGLVRDATDGVWKLFSGVSTEPTTEIDFTSPVYDPLTTGNLTISSNGYIKLPTGTTAQRPTGSNGMLRYNTDIGFVEAYQQGSWNAIGITYNGASASTAFRNYADMLNQSVSGTYWVKTGNMASAQQYYVDYHTNGSAWIRLWLATTDNYNQAGYSWDNSETPNLLVGATYFMYAFCNTSNNNLTYPWSFRFADASTLSASTDGNKSSFINYPPMAHGGSGSPLITLVDTTRLADNTTYRGYLRTGISSFGSFCDDGRSGTWGQICLKAGGTGGSATNSGGYSDFPHYTTFYNAGTDNWARSDGNYTTNTVSSSYRFAVYCKLT